MEKLNPPNYLDSILGRIKILKGIVAELENTKLPDYKETVRVIKNHKSTQLYIIRGKKDTNGKYVTKEAMPEVMKILQGQYDKRLWKTAKAELKLLEKFYKQQKKMNTSFICKNYSLQRQLLIKTVTLDNSIYAQKWKSVTYKGKTFAEDEPKLFSANGVRVRSKSEVIIADTLDRFKIPFRYEYPLKTEAQTLYPDFFCLNLRTRQEFYWEHFGMMDNADYAEKTVAKLTLFQSKDIFPGKNLIISMESQSKPLSSLAVERIIKTYLL